MDYPERKSARIPHYDYCTPNYYFVAICTHDRKNIFGNPGNLNNYGKIAEEECGKIHEHFLDYRTDKWVIMPNHIHMILVNACSDIPVTQVIGLYKSGVTRRIHKYNPDLQIWQRSFHDRIIRNQPEYEKIWEYIENNPLKWKLDCFYKL